MKFIPNIWELNEAGNEDVEWPPFIGKTIYEQYLELKQVIHFQSVLVHFLTY